jgi:TIR domain
VIDFSRQGAAMTRIAISYRRDDTGWITGRIFDRLKNRYQKSVGRNSEQGPIVFLDYDSTPVGVDFRNYIKDVFDRCDLLLAIIGPHWIGGDEPGKTRIACDDDWVRIEIGTALKKNIPIVPVLIDRTPMPSKDVLPEELRDLTYRQAAVIDSQIDFNSHMDRLIRQIDRLLGVQTSQAKKISHRRGLTEQQSSKLLTTFSTISGGRTGYVLAFIAACIIGATLTAYFSSRKPVFPEIMSSSLSAALSAIPAAATSHLALIAYGLAVIAYIVTIWRVTRNRNLLQNLQRLPAKDRLSALEIEMGGVRLAAGISPEQWLRSKIHRYYFLSFIATCVAGILVFVLAILNSHGTADISVDLYEKSSIEVPKTKSLLGALLTVASMSKGNAAEAEFVDPSTVLGNAPYPRSAQTYGTPGFLQSDIKLRYDYQKNSDKIIISPILGYADKQRNGERIYGLRWAHQPFVWDFPALSVKIANNTTHDILLSEVVFNVKDSIEDARPIIVVEGPSYNGQVNLYNEGWGPVTNPIVKLDMGCQGLSSGNSFKETLSLNTFLDRASFSITNYVTDSMIDRMRSCQKRISTICFGDRCIMPRDDASPSLYVGEAPWPRFSDLGEIECLDEKPQEVCSQLNKPVDEKVLEALLERIKTSWAVKTGAEVRYKRQCNHTPRVCVAGELDYTGPNGANNTVQFSTIVILEPPGAGAPLAPSYIYNVFLEPGKKGYTQRKSISQAIKPGEVDHFLLRIATSRSANFLFSMDILDSGGNIAWKGTFDMAVLVPRLGAALALGRIAR